MHATSQRRLMPASRQHSVGVEKRWQWLRGHHPCFENGAHELVFRQHIERQSAVHERAMHASMMAGRRATFTVPVGNGLRELLPLVSTVVNVRLLMFI